MALYPDSPATAGDSPSVDGSRKLSSPPEAVRRDRRRRGKTWNTLAVLAFVAALVASPLAALFGYIAIGQIRRSDQRGAALAWIAVGLGWLWFTLLAVVSIAFAIIWAESPLW